MLIYYTTKNGPKEQPAAPFRPITKYLCDLAEFRAMANFAFLFFLFAFFLIRRFKRDFPIDGSNKL